ncbi:MAG: phosphoethanolamine transferase [Pedosphaera sp.]|nr:phosphoethanolamine transferase [Pedosphaera sp.]
MRGFETMILLYRALSFNVVLVIYVALNWLNWEQAGKQALLGTLALLAMSAWTLRHGSETKAGKRWVLVTIMPFLLLMGFHGFLRDFFGVAADDSLVSSAIFGTDRAEALEFLQQYFRSILKHVGVVLVVIILFAWGLRRWPVAGPKHTPEQTIRQGWKTAAVLFALFILVHLNPSMRKQDPLLYFSIRHSKWKAAVESLRQLQTKMAATVADPQLASLHCADENARTLVFALGESVTRLNFSFAGYPRKTTPELDAMGDELIWFSDVVSCDGTTIPALKKILTPATIAQPELWLHKPDVLTMAKKAGYKTFWISNHSTDANGEISIFVSHADQSVLANRGGSRGEGSYDEVVFPALEEALRDPAPRKLIILHLLQAHPAYFYRYPPSFDRFNGVDDAVTRQLKEAGRAFWSVKKRNYYDNALLYTDHILKRSLELCRASRRPVAWLYVPDHGQDVAHYNNFTGHNMRALSQYKIPMIFWRSAEFPAPSVNAVALRQRPYQTDVLDHTLLGLMGISGDYYDSRSDIFSDKFQPSPRIVSGKPYP